MIVTPKTGTLRKYGLTLGDWTGMLVNQDGKCALCLQSPESGRFVVDHLHVRGWAKLTPELRRSYVRGLLCNHCNHRLVGRWVTLEAARRVVEYLEKFESVRVKTADMF